MGSEAATKRNRNLPQQLTLDHVSPATRLLEKRRQMFEVQEALDAQKEEFQRREATFKRREEMLKKKDLELQESLIKFNKFLQENDSKRSRAEKKEKEEIKQRLVKEQEITKLHEALQRQKEQRRLMTLELDKMMKYQFFLESVLDSTEEFPEITDLLSRYDTLDAAHSDLISRQVQGEEETEKARTELTQFVRDKTDEILGYNNTIAELQKLSEQKVSDTREEQSHSDRQLQDVSERTLQLGQVMMACDNIYHRCCQTSSVARKKASKSEDADETDVVIEKLMFIRDYVTDLNSINKTFQARRAEKEALQGSQKKEGEGAAGGLGSTIGGGAASELGKSQAPKSVAPTSVAPASVAPGSIPPQGSAPQSQVISKSTTSISE